MERCIGEVFEFEGKKLKVEESKGICCDGCYFYDKICKENETGVCSYDCRTDSKNVIFKDITDI